ncbi:MAG: hypothetical protein V2J07_01195 [Anaerolineae bacterium]|jgi:hypothetical protein|nr:hypothetical protein [Anaerolineae bacterium]
MKQTKIVFLGLVVMLILVSMGCNLLDLLSSEEQEPEILIYEEESQMDVVEEVIEAVDEPTTTPQPTAITGPLLDHSPFWLIALGYNRIYYVNTQDGVVHELEAKNVFNVLPSPKGGKAALLRAGDEEYFYSLDLLDLNTGEITNITPLMAYPLSWDFWDTPPICEPTADAMLAVEASTPFWTSDGSVLVFISGHEGGYALPYTYYPATGQIIKQEFAQMGGEVHFFDPVIGGDGGLTYTLNSASCLVNQDLKPTADAFWLATPAGDFAVRLLELREDSIGMEVFGWIGGYFAIVAEKDGELRDYHSSFHHLQGVDIYSVQTTEITGISDHFSVVQVAQPFNSVAFISEGATSGEKITEPGLYYWSIFDQSLVKLYDYVGKDSDLGWDFEKAVYFAKVEDQQGEVMMMTFFEDGSEAQYWVTSATQIPVFPSLYGIHEYYAWQENQGLFVQSFDDVTPIKLTNYPYSEFIWHPERNSLAFFDQRNVYIADQPYFSPISVMTVSEEGVFGIYWVGP